MAKKSKEDTSVKGLTEGRCGDCDSAYGFCVRGADGRPIFCRCEHRPGRLILRSEEACEHFGPRTQPIPTEFPYGPSESRDGLDKTEKVVPIFDKDNRLIRCIPVSSIGAAGIHYDGTPISKE